MARPYIAHLRFSPASRTLVGLVIFLFNVVIFFLFDEHVWIPSTFFQVRVTWFIFEDFDEVDVLFA